MRQLVAAIIVSGLVLLPLAVSGNEQGHGESSTPHSTSGPKAVERVQNEIVSVHALTTGRPGAFTIGNAEDDPLLYNHPQEQNPTHINAIIDGVIYTTHTTYVTGTPPLGLIILPYESVPDTTISCTWEEGPVTIEQRLTPVKFSDVAGAIFIEYIVTNNDTSPHGVGVLLFMDIMVGKADAPPLITPSGYISEETKWDQELGPIPSYFQAHEETPDNPLIVAQGTLIGGQAVPPDVFILGNRSNLITVTWQYEVAGPIVDDCAVILRWGPRPLEAGEQTTFSTYYGIGDFVGPPPTGDIAINIPQPPPIECIDDALAPHSFELIATAMNIGTLPATNVRAELTLPSGLSLMSGYEFDQLIAIELAPEAVGSTSWSVWVDAPDRDIIHELGVLVYSDNLGDSTSAAIFIPVPSCQESDFHIVVEPPQRTITPGESTDFTVSIVPDPGFIGTVDLSFTDNNIGFFTQLQPINITYPGTATLTVSSDYSLTAGNYPFFVHGTHMARTRSDTAVVHVEGQIEISPNPFTPNDDGINDAVIFKYSGLGPITPEVEIYHMDGHKIPYRFVATAGEIPWDGTDFNGVLQPPGVYLYVLRDGSKELASGTVVLAR